MCSSTLGKSITSTLSTTVGAPAAPPTAFPAGGGRYAAGAPPGEPISRLPGAQEGEEAYEGRTVAGLHIPGRWVGSSGRRHAGGDVVVSESRCGHGGGSTVPPALLVCRRRHSSRVDAVRCLTLQSASASLYG